MIKDMDDFPKKSSVSFLLCLSFAYGYAVPIARISDKLLFEQFASFKIKQWFLKTESK